MKLKFGMTPPTELWQQDLATRQQILSDIAMAGFDHVFLADHVSFHTGAGADGFVEVAALSQLHASLKVMIGIYLLPLRHPLPVARQIASMAKIAPGRFIFGVGVGGEDRHEIEVCGVDPRTRGTRTNESLEIVTRLLAGERVNYKGEHFDVTDARIKPTPAAPIPILIGGRSDAALARTARYGDGWLAAWVSTERFARAVAKVARGAAAADRAPPRLHGLQPWVGVAADRAQARAAVASQMEAFYHIPFSKFERYTPYGTPVEVADQLAQYAAVGCRMFNLKVCTPDPQDEVALGGEVIAALQARVGNDAA